MGVAPKSALTAFPEARTWRIAVKVINHLRDDAMKVFRVSRVPIGH